MTRALTPGSARGTALDDVRRRNLGQVLRLVHHHGAVPRAELTRATGLNRSTVAGLVAQLTDLGLVEEGEPAPTHRVGRPSPTVAPGEGALAIAVNPELDRTDLAVVGLGGRVLERVVARNDAVPSAAEFVERTAGLVRDLAGRAPARVLGVGVAVPGLVDAQDGRVLLAPHLGWRDEPIADALAAATGLPVRAGNDANCGVVAESAMGSARDGGTVVYLNGGASGIGGGIALDGAVLGGQGGMAGEFGHTPGGGDLLCHCGARGCLETLLRRDRLFEALGREVEPAELGAALAAVAPGHPAHAELHRQLRHLGTAVRTVVNVVNPRTAVLGGFLAAMLEAVGPDAVKDAVGPTLPGGLDRVRLVPAALGDRILLTGAAELVFDGLIADPAGVVGAP